MPLSPADFYAFSQATGAPVADTPEKRAQQAPDVVAFRQQQLQAPKKGPSLLDVLGTGALIAGAAAGTYGIARALRNRGVAQGVKQAVVQDVTAQAEQNVRRAAAYGSQEPTPSRVATTAPVGTTSSPTPSTQPTPSVHIESQPNLAVGSTRGGSGIQLVNIRVLPPETTPSRPAATLALPAAAQAAPQSVVYPRSDSWHQDYINTAVHNESSLQQNASPLALPPAQPKVSPYGLLQQHLVSTSRIQPSSAVEPTQSILKRLAMQDLSLSGTEDQQGQIHVILSKLNGPHSEDYYVTSHPLTQHPDPKYQQYALQNQQQALNLLAKANIQPQEAVQHIHGLFNTAPTETLVDQQHSALGATINQNINAVTSSEDQVTGRMKYALQQNPHLVPGDPEYHNRLDNIIEAQNRAALGLSTRTGPLDTSWMQEPARTVASTQPTELTGPQVAAAAFAQRRAALAEQGIHGLRAEQLLAEHLLPGAPYVEGPEGYQQRKEKQGLTLGLQTGDPNILKVFATGELEPQITVPWGGTQLGKLSTSEFIAPTTLPEAVEGAQARHAEKVAALKTKLNDITNEIQPQINQLEHQQYQEYVHAQERIPEIDNTLMQIEHHLSRGPSSGSGELLGYRGALTAERNKLSQYTGDHLQDQIDQLNHRLNRANEVYGGLIAEQQVKVPQTLKAWSTEGLKVAPEQVSTQQAGYRDEVTGEFHPSKQVESGPSVPILTQEGLTLGSVSKARDLERKGGGGRNVGEYVAGKREPEVVRALKGGGRIRDYDPETGAVAEHYQPDETQTKQVYVGKRFDPQSGTYVPEYQTLGGLNRALDVYGIRRATDLPDDPTKRPTAFTGTVTASGPVISKQMAKQSVTLSEAVRKGQMQMPRQQLPQQSLTDPNAYFVTPSLFTKRETTTMPAHQLNLPSDVVPQTPWAARVRTTPADLAAQQLESYMSKLQRGRSTPLTSEVVIQPRLF